jgi:beta-lactamase superfamily II metal-dependent hydrolase
MLIYVKIWGEGVDFMKKILLVILSLSVVITLSGCVIEQPHEVFVDGLNFRLEGENIINMTTGESYLEPGFEAYFGSVNLEGDVVIEGSVDNTTPGVYFLEYVLDYDGEEYRLLRAVVVTETTVVVNPDQVLYDGTCDEVDIHYLSLGSMGASTIIDYCDFEIVIDAGLKSAGTDVVVPYLETLVDDGTIELVIATHPDADHIGGFVGLSGEAGVFNSFTIERILDYGYTKSTTTHEQYAELRDSSGALVCSGDDALNSKNLCQPYFTIASDLILTVIDTGHYDGEDTTNDNENSIVVLLEHGDNTFLFTGDAESNAEAFMSSELSHVDVFQAGHHGSNTANTDLLLNAITPTDIILIVDFPDDEDGENGYGIPQQDSLDRMFGQTDNIYATGVSGTIVINSNGTTYTITGTDNTTLLKDSDWFSTHRTYPTE